MSVSVPAIPQPWSKWRIAGFLGLVAAYVAIPLLAALLYSLATRWGTRLLPDGYTLSHWIGGFTDPRFLRVLLHSLGLATAVAATEIALLVPAIYWQRVRNPAIGPMLQLLAAIPFAIPILVIAFGLLQVTGDYLPQAQGTVWLLYLSHVAIGFPFVYWALDNAMAAAGIEKLSEAARCCGAGTSRILWQVVLPNIGAGLATGLILGFGTSFNEIALAQFLTGSRFETVQLYLLNMLKSSDADYNLMAVMTIVNFTVTLILSVTVVWLNGGGKVPGKDKR